MNKRTLGNMLAVLAVLCFLVAIIGMASNGSHRWVEPLEELGWIFFVGCLLVLYLASAPETTLNLQWAKAAWAFGALSIALLLAAFIANIAAVTYRYWFEAIETAGVVAMLATVLCAITARGGWGRKRE